MKREKYKYSQFPSDGVRGIDRDLAMELACKCKISAHYWVTGPESAYKPGEDRRFIVELETILLCSDTLYQLDFTGHAPLDYFQRVPFYDMKGELIVYCFSNPRQIKRDDVVFYVNELERYSENHSGNHSGNRLPEKVCNQTDAMISIAKKIDDRNIRSHQTLSQALEFERLLEQAKMKLGKEALQKNLLQEVRETLPISFSKEPPSVDTIRKCLSSLEKIRKELGKA